MEVSGQNCIPETAVSTFLQYSVCVDTGNGVKRQWGGVRRQLSVIFGTFKEKAGMTT